MRVRPRDLIRPPLDAAELHRALVVPHGWWTRVEVRQQTASTNVDVTEAALAGAPEGLVVAAERQTAGRGRLDRRWESPERAGIAVSVLLRPSQTPTNRYGWLPLLAGVALVSAVRRVAKVDAALKWPNDLLVHERKCGGILAEVVPAATTAVVLGIGVNVTLRPDELPTPEATSLELAGAACTDRSALLCELLRELATWYVRWRDHNGDPHASGVRDAYLAHCATVGQHVRVDLPDGGTLAGRATTVDSDGQLVVMASDGSYRVVAAGDVQRVRR